MLACHNDVDIEPNAKDMIQSSVIHKPRSHLDV